MLASLVYLSLSFVFIWFLLVSGLLSFLFLHISFWWVGWFDLLFVVLCWIFLIPLCFFSSFCKCFPSGVVDFYVHYDGIMVCGSSIFGFNLKASSSSITIAVVLFVMHFVVSIWSTTDRFSGLFHSSLVHCPLFTLVVAVIDLFLFMVSCKIFPFLDSFWLIWSMLILALKSPPRITSVVFFLWLIWWSSVSYISFTFSIFSFSWGP